MEPQGFRNADACLRGWTTALRAADAFVMAARQLGLKTRLIGAH